MKDVVTDHEADIRRRLGEWYSPDEVEAWLHAPQLHLDGAVAIELIRAGDTAPVIAILDRLDAGAYL